MKILITGASGYIGGHLLDTLPNEQLRCFIRSKRNYLEARHPKAEFFYGDARSPQDVSKACKDIDVIYYLIHAMGSTGDFSCKDRDYAQNFAAAAKHQGVKKIIYVGGLTDTAQSMSTHMASRCEVGRILRESEVPVLEFRASIILGAGSLSFEMIRSLVEHLPIMICPRWVRARCQPIYIGDLLKFLTAALDGKFCKSKIFEVGGSEISSYKDLMLRYAKLRGLRRHLISVPILTPHLSSLWLGLVTPLYARVGRKIIDSLRQDSIISDNDAGIFFDINCLNIEEAIKQSLQQEDESYRKIRWNDAMAATGHNDSEWHGIHFGNRLVDSRHIDLKCPAKDAFRPILTIGGNNGWYYGNWLWKLRGWLDLLWSGPGLRRGRRNQDKIYIGDTIDFWRVEDYIEDKKLLLRAEMKLPGRAWLEYEVETGENNQTQIRQTAIFDPVGLIGLIYWYSVAPLHFFVFGGMLKAIGDRACGKISRDKMTIEN